MDPISDASVTGSPFAGPGGLGKEDFLRLLVTQLQYQDPLDPLDAQDFASQLAEFTAMEQQLLTNELLEAQIDMSSASMIESQNSIAIGMIGNDVVADGDRAVLSGSSSDAVYLATSGAASLQVSVQDASGQVVASTTTAVPGDGVHRVPLGEAAEDLEPGTYTVVVELVEAPEGVTARSLSSGIVQGVRWGDSGPVLVVGSEEISLSNVLQISNQEQLQP